MSAMSSNWVLNEAKRADTGKGFAILENPAQREQLDAILLGWWPEIKAHLRNTDFQFSPTDTPLLETRLGPTLERVMLIMLFDEVAPICRINVACSLDHWIIDNEFFLVLPREADILKVCNILGNSRLAGNPPMLSVHPRNPGTHFLVTLRSGRGESWGAHDRSFILEKIKKSIDVNIEMHNSMIDGDVTVDTVAAFLTEAYEVYEAH